MDKLKFSDGTIINIEDGAYLGAVVHIAANEADAMFACSKVTVENVNHLEFIHNDVPIGIYDNIAIAMPTTREDSEDGAIIVRMHFRQKTDLEIRVDALEEGQSIQDGAIEDIGMVLSDLVEG